MVFFAQHEVHTLKGQFRIPIQFRSYSRDGSIHIHLPRSFRGLFRIKTRWGTICFSEAIESSSTFVSESEANGFKIRFVGFFDATEWQSSVDWNGDELILETKDGNVSVYFDDEENGAAQPQRGFLSKIFKS